MKTKNMKYKQGFLALVCGLILVLSCRPEFDPDLVTYPDISVDGFGPVAGYPGSVVTITGSNFGHYSEAAKVSFGDVVATEFLSYGDSVMEVIVPPLAQSGKLSLQVWTHLKDSVGSYTVIPLPVISLVESNSEFGVNIAFPGDIITLTGSGFGTDASKLAVAIGGAPAKIIPPVNNNLIRIEAPETFPTGNVALTIGGVTITGQPAMINPTAGGDITPYFMTNTGDTTNQGLFKRDPEIAPAGDRWGTMPAPWVSNNAIRNKTNNDGVKTGGWAHERWGAPEGYICFETWGNTPITDGKLYQQTAMELPAGDYTFFVKYYSEVVTNSTVHIVAAAGDGLPSLPDIETSLGYVKTWNDTQIGGTEPNITETKEVNFTLETSQKVSLGFLANMQGASEKAGYFKVLWVKLVKH